MSSSESEAFESADEDFDYKVSPKHHQKGVHRRSKNNSVSSNKSQDGIAKTPQKEATSKNKESRADETKGPTASDNQEVADQVVKTEANQKMTKEAIPSDFESKQQSKGIQEQLTVKEVKDVSVDNKKMQTVDEAWDLDDWGDETNDEPENEKIDAEPEGQGDWGDFDDWGITDTASKTSKPQTITSNYDTFPVLNDLSPKKSYSFKPEKHPEGPTSAHGEGVAAKEASPQANSSWSNWKPWGGVVSLISTATEGVSTLTSHVSQGLSTVIESSIGVPNPEEMAKIQKEQAQSSRNASLDRSTSSSNEILDSCVSDSSREDKIRQGFGNLVSGVTNIGTKVISGGLDTLEGIGKKTMTILQENDPLLLNKRKFLGIDSEKPVLSHMLREAKEKSEETEKNLKQMQKNSYKKQLHFETLFDHYHGLVHLEALEMLSKQSSIKLQSLIEPLSGKALVELQETLNEVKELCELGEMDSDDGSEGNYSPEDLSQKFNTAVEDLGIKVDFNNIIKCWTVNSEWLQIHETAEPQEIYEHSMRCLAETSALAVHIMHKLAEMLLIKDHHSTANEADALVQLTMTFCWHLNGVANRFGSKLNTFESTEEISALITNIFLEESNSISYIQNAFQLFIPILQIGAA